MIAQKTIPYLGTIPPMAGETTRFTAETRFARAAMFARTDRSCKRLSVVAAFPQWAETYRLNRYPSPDRRPRAFLHGPPFFIEKPSALPGKRGIAQNHLCRCDVFDPQRGLALSARTQYQNTRGTSSCDAVRAFPFHLFFWAHWPLAAIRLASRPLSAQPQAQAPRRSWAGLSLPGRPLARRATSPSARFIPRDADALTRQNTCAPFRGATVDVGHRCTGVRRWSFYVQPIRRKTGAGQKEGT